MRARVSSPTHWRRPPTSLSAQMGRQCRPHRADRSGNIRAPPHPVRHPQPQLSLHRRRGSRGRSEANHRRDRSPRGPRDFARAPAHIGARPRRACRITQSSTGSTKSSGAKARSAQPCVGSALPTETRPRAADCGWGIWSILRSCATGLRQELPRWNRMLERVYGVRGNGLRRALR